MKEKMSEQKQNTSNKQSSLTSENASMLVSEKVYGAADNLNELMQSISRWEAEESSKSETAWSMDCRTHQKVERHLQRFFGLRRVFAENRGDAEEDQMTDNTRGSVTADISTQKSSSDRTFKRKCGRNIFNKIGLFKRKLNKKVAKEQDSDETAKSDSSDSKSGSPATIASVCTTENMEGPAKAQLSSVPLELVDVEENDDDLIKNHIVREIEAAPGSSLDIETATKADLDSVPLEPLDVENEEIPPEDNGKSNCSLSPPAHHNRERSSVAEKDLSFVPLELVEVEENYVMEDHIGSEANVAPGPSKHVSAAAMIKAVWKGLFKWRPKNKVGEQEDVGETAESDSSDFKSRSSCPEDTVSTASVSSSEDIRDAKKADLSSVPLELVDVEENYVMKDHIVRERDAAPGPSLDISTATKADLDSVPLEVLDVEKEEIPTDNGKSNSSSSPPPHQNRERSSVAEKDLRFVPLEMDDVEDNDVMEDNLVKKIDVTPGPFLDVRTATKADLKSVPSEILDVENEEILPEDKQYKKSTSSSSPQHLHRERSSVAEKDLSSVPLEFIDMDTNTKNTIYTLIMCFFDTLTKEQQTELCKRDYSMNMKNKIADLTAEVFMHITQAVSHNIEKCSIGGQLVDISRGLTPELMETIEKMIHSVLSEIEQAHPVVIKKRWFSKLWENKVYPISDISDNNSAVSLKFVDQNATPKNRRDVTLLKRICQFCCSLSCCSRTEDVYYLNPLSPSPASEVPARTVINGPQFI